MNYFKEVSVQKILIKLINETLYYFITILKEGNVNEKNTLFNEAWANII